MRSNTGWPSPTKRKTIVKHSVAAPQGPEINGHITNNVDFISFAFTLNSHHGPDIKEHVINNTIFVSFFFTSSGHRGPEIEENVMNMISISFSYTSSGHLNPEINEHLTNNIILFDFPLLAMATGVQKSMKM